ncbi:uncharacterized protein LOC132725915 [Ruditapes philippinarum]|uniref:uncharacterized protein LOC132725915 n=1 Tax=Ruditapes philippinarum TaxID=129788 RepID=UPI00295A80F7|nr:uncharacterized protein LOC132725915 [Ruditapes philippinarum]
MIPSPLLAIFILNGLVENVSAYNNTLPCRVCHRASTLSECNTVVDCDRTLEDCYLDQLVTENLTIVYDGGCRSKVVCNTPFQGRRSSDLVACSRCCNFENECNTRLCGIKDDTHIHDHTCYNCDHRTSGQSEVADPSHCVTFTTCRSEEMCYATESDVGGRTMFFYGCLNKRECGILMGKAFDNYKMCVANVTQPPAGVSRDQACRNVGKRSASLCRACCDDRNCNYGTCEELQERIFKLAILGKFNMTTLRSV